MRRKYLFLGLIVAVAVTAVVVWQRNRGTAEQAREVKVKEPDDRPKAPPITQVIVFNSGVAYFQREGTVEGDARVDLSFAVSDVNDILKSLVVEDLDGGTVRTVSYDSQEPVEKTLKGFALDLTGNPSLGQLLNQARGEKVEVTLAQNAGGQAVSGVIMGMEAQNQRNGKDVVEVEVLNVKCAEGLRGLPLGQVQRVRFLNAALDAEFNRALEVLAGSHNSQKRTVSISFTGEGKRRVRIGYVVENPIWKSTYRLTVDKAGKPSLQGWAVVENTTDEDWRDVRMVLVSGRPVSFQMDLYQPLYVPRPMVESEMFASLRPPVYAGTMEEDPRMGIQGIQIGGIQIAGIQIGGIQIGGIGAIPNQGMQGIQMQGIQGIQLGGLQGMPGWNRFQPITGIAPGLMNATARLTFEELQQRRRERRQAREEARNAGKVIAAQDPGDRAALEGAEEVSDSYQYRIDKKVTLPRQKSALLPIVKKEIAGARVSIYNEHTHTRFPMHGLKFKNGTGQNLMQGPVSVFDRGTYAGDARLPDLQPDEQRLISFAVDLGLEVKPEDTLSVGPRMVVRPANDGVKVHFTQRRTRSYLARNRSKQDRLLVIEHPIRSDWKLVGDNKPYESSRDTYRFEVAVPAGKTVRYEVAEEQPRTESSDSGTTATEDGVRTRTVQTRLGLQVQQVLRPGSPEVLAARIQKGVLHVTARQQDTRTYRIRNLTSRDREVVLEHEMRANWKLVGDAKPVAGNAGLYRFPHKLPAGKIVEQVLTEQRSDTEGRPVRGLSDEDLRGYQANKAVSAKVRAALAEAAGRRARLALTQRQAEEFKKKLKAITDEQARLRANIDKVPKDSAAYKHYLDKFDKQETQIEKLQEQIAENEEREKAQVKEYDEYLKGLTVE
jgi:hypothetical protein